MASKRSTKFYRKNEAEVMEMLGLKATKNSGAGWIEKSDGQNESVICELKSTDANSYRLNKLDLNKLQYNGMVAHKVPVFAVQFLKSDEVYLVLKPQDLMDLAEGLKNGLPKGLKDYEELVDIDDVKPVKPKQIKGSKSARQAFHKTREERYNKEKKAW